MSRLRPAPVDTLPHLTTEALLSGIRAGAGMILERDVDRARSVETEEGMLLSSLLQYVECVEARLRGRCPHYVLDEHLGTLEQCELTILHPDQHRATVRGNLWAWGPGPCSGMINAGEKRYWEPS